MLRAQADKGQADKGQACDDGLPAAYRRSGLEASSRTVAVPARSVRDFLSKELCLGKLDLMLGHLWFAGDERPAAPLHSQLAIGREIVVCERMDLHLLWWNTGKIFMKPVPRFLLDHTFWTEHLTCPAGCACQAPATPSPGGGNRQETRQVEPACAGKLRKVALGFLFTYTCLISYESDFHVANETRLLPRLADDKIIQWTEWKKLVDEILSAYDPSMVHPRFWRGELRLERLNTIHRFTQLSPFDPYFRSWRNYGALFRDNLTWLSATTVFVALVLTAMQVGLATEQLQDDPKFMAASYGFTVFAIIGPISVFGLVVLASLFNLAKDLPRLLGMKKTPPATVTVPAQTPSLAVQGPTAAEQV